MPLQKRRIGNGINLSYLETDKFKTGYLSVNFIAPLSKESAALNAIIPAILMRGSKKYPNMAEINKALDYLYASSLGTRNSKRGEMQIFGISAGMLDSEYTINGEDLLSDVADMLFDILLCPMTEGEAFDAAYTESEKNNLIDAINGKINNKTYYARMRCTQEMCKNERFGLAETGTSQDVSAITPQSAYMQYRYALKNYPIEILFVGKCDVDALERKLSAHLSALERTPMSIPETEIIRKAESVRRVTEDMPVNQGKLVMGFRTGTVLRERDYCALVMANEIFGGGVTSKLFMNVREKMSLCYYCQSSADGTKGLMLVQSGIEVDKREVAEKAIFDQLEAVKRGEFSDEEMLSARLGIVNSYKELSDSARGLETWYLGRMLEGINGDPEDVVREIERVTRAEIVAAINKVSADTVYFLNGTLKGDDADE